MLPLLAFALLHPSADRPFKETTFDGLLGKGSLMIHTATERIEPPKISPKNAWEFDWSTAGLVGSDARREIRFEVFSQESTQSSARPESVLRTLLRLFSFNLSKMSLDHASDFSKCVTVYLCYGGEPGGEQLFDVDKSLAGSKVNTIYLYDLRSFTDPVETTREVAHEYGHAVLPPVGGGYTAPEAWANGYLGEKLYMSYLADARSKGTLGPEDTFGATPEALRVWVRKNVDPLIEKALSEGPRDSMLAGKDKAAMDSFFGLALATSRLYNPRVLCRALFTAGMDPKDFPDAASTAAEEPDQTELTIPEALLGKSIWIPLGHDSKKSVVMGASVIERRKDGWAHLRLGKGPVVVKNYRD